MQAINITKKSVIRLFCTKNSAAAVTTLHNINLQRVDRLDDAAQYRRTGALSRYQIYRNGVDDSAQHKIVTMPNGQRMEKWILRKACEDLLPPEIVWRTKEQFDEGSGTVDLLR